MELAPVIADCLAEARGKPGIAADLLQQRALSDLEVLKALVGEELRKLVLRSAVRAIRGVEVHKDRKLHRFGSSNRNRPAATNVAAPDASAGYELLALSNARSLLDFPVKPGVPLRSADRDVLSEASDRLSKQAVQCEVVARWYGRIAGKLSNGHTVEDACSEAELKDMLRDCVTRYGQGLGMMGMPDRAKLMAGK